MLCSYCGEHLTCDSERVPCPYDPGTGCAIIIPCCYKPPPGQVTPAQPAVWTSTSRCATPGLLTSSLATLYMGSTWDLSPPGGVDLWQTNFPESSIIFHFSNVEMMNVSTISDDKLMDIIKLVKETYNKFLKVVLKYVN